MTLVAVGALAAPFVSSAAYYHYLDLSGTVRGIEANSATEALAQVNAQDNSLHSGVKLDTGELKDGESYGRTYLYVSTTGETKSVSAASLDAAYMLATDRANTSGFLVVE